jgi:WD40 repeat protein
MFTLTEDRILRKWGNTLGSAAIANAKHDCAQWLEFSPDDKFIMSCGGYASKLWRASDLSLVREFLGDWYSVAFHPMGHRLLLLGPRSIIDMNIEDLEIITATEHKLYFDVFDVVFDPSGNIFAATTDQGVVKIIAANMTEEKASLPYNDVRRMRFTPDGKYLLLVRGSKTVVLWDVAAGCTIDELILYLDLESVYLAEISKCCRVLSFDDGMGSAYTIHLGSTCY